MASMTYDSFLDDISSERGVILSLSSHLEDRWWRLWCAIRLTKLNFRLGKLLSDLDNWEKENSQRWQDDGYLTELKSYLEGLTEDLRNLSEHQINHNIYPAFAQIQLGISERFDEKIEMLSISTDSEIKNLITAIGDKVSH